MLKLFVINKYLWQNIIEPIYNKLILGLNLFFIMNTIFILKSYENLFATNILYN